MKKKVRKMGEKQKFKILYSYDRMSSLKEPHFTVLKELSKDKDEFIRSKTAALLINFESNQSKNILMRLAQDKDDLVRIEAYDSLKVFGLEEVEIFLQSAICREKNYLARAYAIMSWAEIVMQVHEKASEKHIAFIKRHKAKEKREHCLLSWEYAEYIFGIEASIRNITPFLESESYLIRCSAVNTLEDVLHDGNVKEIKNALEQLLFHERAYAVRSTAERLLEKMECEYF